MTYFDNNPYIPQPVKENSEDAIAIENLSIAITLEETKLKDLYYEIGKQYIKYHNDSFSPELNALVADAKKSEELIENNKDEINKIKGIAICKNCGCEIGANMLFCFMCGAPVKKSEPSLVIDASCANAYATTQEEPALSQQGAFSPAFEPVNSVYSEPVFEPVYTQDFEPQYAPENNFNVDADNTNQQDDGVCPNCGYNVPEDMIFCQECGTKVR